MVDQSLTVGAGRWTVMSVLLVVSDLDRSAGFYERVMPLRTSLREVGAAVLTGQAPGSPTILLRQAFRNATRSGEQGIGLQAVAFDVGSGEALAEVERRLRELDSFVRRSEVGPAGHCAIVQGRDPDRIPLGFFSTAGELSREDIEALHVRIYTL